VFTLYQNIPLYYVDNGIDCANQLYCLIPTKSCISPGCVLDLSHFTLEYQKYIYSIYTK